MTHRCSSPWDAPAGPGPATWWRLEPLLALCFQAEERERGEFARALAAARCAEGEVASRRATLEVHGGVAPSRGLLGADLIAAERFLARLRRELAGAMERLKTADAAVADARRRHVRARDERARLERQRVCWVEARHRAREARIEYELDDLGARGPGVRGRPSHSGAQFT